jgi:glutamyl-tRNA reductase
MKSQLEADREFFLEVIDDLARDAAQNAHEDEMTPEQFWAHIQREAKEFDRMFPAAVEDVEETEEEAEKVTEEEAADRFRQAIARTDLKELLFLRRYTAKSICKRVARVGTSHATPWAQILKGSLERLQVMDAEIRRRIPGRGPVPPGSGTPEDTTQGS